MTVLNAPESAISFLLRALVHEIRNVVHCVVVGVAHDIIEYTH